MKQETLKKLMVGAFLILHLTVSPLANAGEIRMVLEEPVDLGTYTGVANLRGWAFSTVEMRSIQLYINGDFESNIPQGSARSDVGAAFISNPRATLSGFSMAFNYSGLPGGINTIRIRAEDVEGAAVERTVQVRTVRLSDSFISDPSRINLSSAVSSVNDNRIIVRNVFVDNILYDVHMEWRTGPQSFVITDLVRHGPEAGASIELTRQVNRQ